MARVSVFGDKSAGVRVQGLLTPEGSSRFEEARGRLAKLTRKGASNVSDADVIEYLARGDAETRELLDDER